MLLETFVYNDILASLYNMNIAPSS